jgi:hypothetical protein
VRSISACAGQQTLFADWRKSPLAISCTCPRFNFGNFIFLNLNFFVERPNRKVLFNPWQSSNRMTFSKWKS